MKKRLNTILLSLAILIIGSAALAPHPAHAAITTYLTCLFSPAICAGLNLAPGDFMVSIFADIGNVILSIASWFLGVVGILLNVSIILTMNIKAIYLATPAIRDVWVVIRNLSSLFIIFALLWASIETILDVGKTNVRDLIFKIFVAGMLINFSLFFTKVAIDASNLISLQFYRAIVPNSANLNIDPNAGLGSLLTNSFKNGGLSDVFMYNLQIPRIYDKNGNKSLLADGNGGAWFKIAVSTYAGSALMIIAALSFLAASIAFLVRLVILLLLMGFSPVWFIGGIFPKIESETSKKWLSTLSSQLIFMPVYLLMMYVALRFISTINPNEAGFFDALDKASRASGSVQSSDGILLSMVGLLIQYSIAFILINIPLAMAISFGGQSLKFGEAARKWTEGKLKDIRSNTWRNTGGRIASTLAENESFKKIAAKTFVGEMALKGTRGVAKDYNERLKKDTESRIAFGDSLASKGKELKSLQKELAIAVAKRKAAKGRGDSLVGHDMYIEGLEEQIGKIENGNKEAYAGRIGTRTLRVFGSANSLWTMMGRDNKDAAKKIKDQIEKGKTEGIIDDIKEEIEELKKENTENKNEMKSIYKKERENKDLTEDEKRFKAATENMIKVNNEEIGKKEVLIASLKEPGKKDSK